MQGYIQELKNGVGIRIPAKIAKQLHFEPGCPITLAIENGRLVINPAHYNLDLMLDCVTNENEYRYDIALDLISQNLRNKI